MEDNQQVATEPQPTTEQVLSAMADALVSIQSRLDVLEQKIQAQGAESLELIQKSLNARFANMPLQAKEANRAGERPTAKDVSSLTFEQLNRLRFGGAK